MKKLILSAALLGLFACAQDNDRAVDDDPNNAENSMNSVEHHSEKNISPQLEKESDTRLKVDTISNAQDGNEGKKGDLH